MNVFTERRCYCRAKCHVSGMYPCKIQQEFICEARWMAVVSGEIRHVGAAALGASVAQTESVFSSALNS